MEASPTIFSYPYPPCSHNIPFPRNTVHFPYPRISIQALAASQSLVSRAPLKDKSVHWHMAEDGINGSAARKNVEGDRGPIVAVVLLGWLGSEPSHLMRYVRFYNKRGIHAITFAAPIMDVLSSLTLGKRLLRERVPAFTLELASWISGTEIDGRERFLLFHTFSNAGWIVYGSILDELQGRHDLLEKIIGCVVDSGGDKKLNPKVWATAFTTALLAKPTTPASSSVEAGEVMTPSRVQEKKPLQVVFLLLVFERVFSVLLILPYSNKLMTNAISALSEKQPPCPQLYLYSTADKVISSQSVESFMEDQKKQGKKVESFNFGSSRHVDHYRTFGVVYSSQVERFLKECLAMVKLRQR
ncbi:hypothetical protein RJ639_019833 [Escallonia herrerae]|uniref:Transmembrane protein 53 n=1 Tax=Escallonia herrerae TaxID=1293975 RepID=A0AA88V841_9ASTE|nr:hypothetical protein RJ639_019833 [Escallonia herrerae]